MDEGKETWGSGIWGRAVHGSTNGGSAEVQAAAGDRSVIWRDAQYIKGEMDMDSELVVKSNVTKYMTKETVLGVVARIWCDPDYSWVVMNVELAEKIAQLLLDEAISQYNRRK